MYLFDFSVTMGNINYNPFQLLLTFDIIKTFEIKSFAGITEQMDEWLSVLKNKETYKN